MRRCYLVDGYNVVFALGLFDRRAGARALELARRRLLDYLHDQLGPAAHEVTVVFDARRRPPGRSAAHEYRGVQVQFATGGEFADDVIERLIAAAAAPQQLVVISNDHRVQEAARRKGAQPWTCTELLDHGPKRHEPPDAPGAPERPEAPSAAEVRQWLEEFGDLADDPDFRELFDPYPFGDDV